MERGAQQARLEDQERLSKELASAVLEDDRRRAVDEMKKRSVLTARSYDEFRNLVACAQQGQKPLTSKEMEFLGKPGRKEGFVQPCQRAATWRDNRYRPKATRAASLAHRGAGSHGAVATGGPPTVPQTLQDFERLWRRQDVSVRDKVTVLLEADPTALFRVELNDLGGLLAAILSVYTSSCEEREPVASLERLAAWLVDLTTVERFGLAAMFFTAQDRQVANDLLDLLDAGAPPHQQEAVAVVRARMHK